MARSEHQTQAKHKATATSAGVTNHNVDMENYDIYQWRAEYCGWYEC